MLFLAYLQHLQNLLATEPLVHDSDASKALVARSRATVGTPCAKSHPPSQGGGSARSLTVLPWPLHQGQSDAGTRKNPPTPPQKLEEVLVVLGGRVLEEGEDEDRGLEMPAAPRNFASSNPKSSKCPQQGWGKRTAPRMFINPLSTAKATSWKMIWCQEGHWWGGREEWNRAGLKAASLAGAVIAWLRWVSG